MYIFTWEVSLPTLASSVTWTIFLLILFDLDAFYWRDAYRNKHVINEFHNKVIILMGKSIFCAAFIVCIENPG